MTDPAVQEFRLFRILMVVNILVAAMFIPLQWVFMPPAHQPHWTWVHIWTVIYPAVLWRVVTPRTLKAGAVLFIALHLLTDSLSLLWHPLEFKAQAFVWVYTFIIIFNVILVSWPEVLASDLAILACGAGFAFLPASGFHASMAKLGLNPGYAEVLVLMYFALLLIVGTSIMAVKRRTERRVYELNANLNRLVDQKLAEIQRADAAARQYQEQLDVILRHAPFGVVIVDEHVNFLYTNGVHFKFRLTAAGVEELPGSLLPLAVLRQEVLAAKAQALLTTDRAFLGQRWEYTAPQGVVKILRYSFVRVIFPEADGDVIRLVLLSEDITQEETIRQELNRADHLASLGKMAASLAHEVNNPLAGIKLYVELLEQEISSPEKRREIFRFLESNITRIDRIVKSFLTFSRQEKPRREWLDVQEVLRTTLEMASNFRQFHRIHIHTHLAATMPLIYADPHRLAQVFVNLLNNASDAMQAEGGRLDISTRLWNQEIWIQFKDTGKGIKPENLPHIFKPFFTTKEKDQGTGLGLSTSYSIIQEHGGRLEVESEVSLGSTFTVRLPIIQREMSRDVS